MGSLFDVCCCSCCSVADRCRCVFGAYYDAFFERFLGVFYDVLAVGVIIIGVNTNDNDATQTGADGTVIPSSADQVADAEAMKAAVKFREVHY